MARLPQRLTDWALVAFVGLVSIGNAARSDRPAVFVPVALATTLVLLRRRERPGTVLAIVLALTVAAAAAHDNWQIPALLVALGTYAATVDRRRSFIALLGSVVLLAIPLAAFQRRPLAALVPEIALFAVAWFWGESGRAREQERVERERSAVAAERTRIARELHDIVTHSVSVMVVQAAAGNDVFDSHPDRAREALQAVEETGRRALGELRRLLDVEAGDGALPQPGLARVDELVAQVRRTGLPVDLVVEGTAGELPEGVDLSAYRIVQEALTNTLRHAHASRATVLIRHAPDSVEIEVADDGVGAPAAAAGGRGLVGMRERVALFGGELTAGGGPEGGFRVHARVPVGSR